MRVASIVRHCEQAKAREKNGNVHLFHYADMTRSLSGQISRLAGILGISVSPELLSEITGANTFASRRKQTEASEARFEEASPFHDQADFFASGTSNKWVNRLTDDDLAAYEAKIATVLHSEDVDWLNWGDRRSG